MSFFKFQSRLACVASIALTSAVIAAPASAQIVFEWGGDKEWGGGRQTVRFHPEHKPGDVIVSFSDRRLYYVTRPGQALSYPIAVPREQSRWEGVTAVSQKRENPSWTPTPEMIRENPKLPSWVPGGHPMNPMGIRALYLGSSTYRIHGTDAPWTIGQAVSKGCIRMFNEDVLDLYPRVNVGAKVIVTWKKFNGGPAIADVAPETTPGTGFAQIKKQVSSEPVTSGQQVTSSATASAQPGKVERRQLRRVSARRPASSEWDWGW